MSAIGTLRIVLPSTDMNVPETTATVAIVRPEGFRVSAEDAIGILA
jgi:hypothetical protein